MIPLTVPETACLLSGAKAIYHKEHWSDWRCRRHQPRSRWYHQRTRLIRDAEIALLS